MPPKKSPIESASCHLAEARSKWLSLADDSSVSAKHRRSMKAAVKSLDKAMAKLACVSGKRVQSGGNGELYAPGQLNPGEIASNSNGLALAVRDPLGAATMARIVAGQSSALPFSLGGDEALYLPTSGMDPALKANIAPNLGGYVNAMGTTLVPTLVAGGGKRAKRTKPRKA
jgi:hypothetical protein